MNAVKFAVAAVAASFVASAATAASLSLVGGGYQNQVLANYDLMPDLDGETISFLTGAVKNNTNGLAVSGPARVTYTYLGSEAANTNFSASVGGTQILTQASSIGTSFTNTVMSGGLLDFLFATTAPIQFIGTIINNSGATPQSNDFAIGYYQDGNTWYALFDDIRNGDRDFDDFALKIDVAPIPLPAAGFLLLGGLGALGAVARRRNKA